MLEPLRFYISPGREQHLYSFVGISEEVIDLIFDQEHRCIDATGYNVEFAFFPRAYDPVKIPV